MKRDESGPVFRANLEYLISLGRFLDLHVHRLDHGMVFLPLIRAAHEADADDVIASVRLVQRHVVQRQIARNLAANSAPGINRLDGQERAAIKLGEFFAKLPPIIAAYVLCVHNFKDLMDTFPALRLRSKRWCVPAVPRRAFHRNEKPRRTGRKDAPRNSG